VKIAIIGLKGIPDGGGVETVVTEISAILAEREHEVTVYCRRKYMKKGWIPPKGVSLKFMFAFESKRLGQISHSLFSAIDATFRNYDIILIHSYVNVGFSIIPRLFGKKVVSHLHGFEWEIDKWSKFDKFILRMMLPLIKIPHAVTSASSEQRKFLKNHMAHEKLLHIPNGTNELKQKELNVALNHGLEKNKYILFVGRLTFQKGIDLLINAFKNINTDFKLIIAGGQYHANDYETYLKNLANGDKRIIFLGNVSSDFLAELYSNGYFVVLPSTSESAPKVLLEALGYGACVLSSDLPNLQIVAKKHAIYFKTGSKESLRDQITVLLKNSELVNSVKKDSVNYVMKHFNWNDILDSYENLYRNVLNNDSPSKHIE